jgi:hypothetical protein
VKTERPGGCARGSFIDQQVGNPALHGQGDGGDFAGVEVGVGSKDRGDGGRLRDRDEARKSAAQ